MHRVSERSGVVSRNFDNVSWLYYLAFVLYLFAYYLDKTTISSLLFVKKDTIVDLFRVASVLALIVKFAYQKFSPAMFMVLGTVGVLTVAAFAATHDWNLVLMYFFVVVSREVSIKRLAKYAFITDTIILISVLTFAWFGLIDSVERYRIVDGMLKLRSSMGFSHPNQFGQCVMAICCAYAVLRFPDIKYYDMLVYGLGALLCNTLADSRTSVACILFIVIAAILSSKVRSKQDERRLSFGAAVCFLALTLVSLYLMVTFDSGTRWMKLVNSILSSRFQLAHYYFQTYRPKLLGRPVNTMIFSTISFTQHGPDNAYVRILLQDGYIMSIILMLIYVSTIITFARIGVFNECVYGLLVYAVVAVMEANSLHFAANYFLAGCSCVIFGWDQFHSCNPTISELRMGLIHESSDGELGTHRTVVRVTT